MIYFEMGSQGDGTKPESFFPTVESFIGETGTFLAPDALKNKGKGCPAGCTVDGKEAMGAMAFPEITLAAGAHVDYILLGGMTEDPKLAEQAAEMFARPNRQMLPLNRQKITGMGWSIFPLKPETPKKTVI